MRCVLGTLGAPLVDGAYLVGVGLGNTIELTIRTADIFNHLSEF